ncbi:MAG: SAM-dependent methyltransferase [Nocardioidaceae bacterium]
MDVRDTVRNHYGRSGLTGTILDALSRAGIDTDALTVADLAPLDELHAGGRLATEYLLGRLELHPGHRLLDVGCGIGGPSRLAASSYPVDVIGIDLSPEFVATATALTGRVGLSDRVGHREESGESLSFDDASFDRAMMIHVGMNVPDKRSVFADVRRVLKPEGLFGLFEQMRTGEGALQYPLPWAEDESSSFVETVDEYVAALTGAGFAVELVEDRTAEVSGPPPASSSGVTAVAVFGPEFPRRIGNNVAATQAGLLGAVLILARAV